MTPELQRALDELGASVLFADAHVLIVDKPFGLPSQGTRDGEPGLIEHVWRAGMPEATLPHRLDRPASGALAVGLCREVAGPLATAFRDHRAKRVYHVVVAGTVSAPVRWDRPLDGKPARTDAAPLGTASGFTTLEVRLHTGRTHQIRRHAALAGHPVVGDRRHGGELGSAWPRLALHAARLSLPHPAGGRTIQVQAPLPDDLARLWAVAGGPSQSTR